jgi:hypothetical protein
LFELKKKYTRWFYFLRRERETETEREREIEKMRERETMRETDRQRGREWKSI